MKRVNFSQSIISLLLLAVTLGACNKASFLDKKPNTQLVVPTTLDDFQALLENQYVMRETPELGELSSDNYYMLYGTWGLLSAKSQNAYLWAKDIYSGQGKVQDWNAPYQQVFYTNVILEALEKIKVDDTNRQRCNTIRGSALFIRAYAFYNLSQVFAPVYDSATAATDVGIPLRLVSDVNQQSVRASVKDTYDQILKDLTSADSLLPDAVPTQNLNRPSRPAALALMGRVYLSMGAYTLAGAAANSCLDLYSTLMKYDTLDATSGRPIEQSNAETLYQSVLYSTSEVLGGIFKTSCIIDSNLYASYAPGDLRKVIFYRFSSFTGLPYLKGSYYGASYCFSGLAVDEVYLIRAECAARLGNRDGALSDLNTLLKNRWDSVGFTPVSAATASAALDSVLRERRKELAFRGLRWTDLRRLNKEGAKDTIYHGLNGLVHRLLPSSLNYVLPIPPDVLSNSNIDDNPRVDPN